MLGADPEDLLLEFGVDGPFKQILLIPEQDARGVLRRVVVQFGHPVQHRLQAAGLRNVENDHGAIDASEELRHYFPESLLAGGVPQLDCPLTAFHRFAFLFELQADGGVGVDFEAAFRHS